MNDPSPVQMWVQFASAALVNESQRKKTGTNEQADNAALMADVMMGRLRDRYSWDSYHERWLSRMKRTSAGGG